MVKLTMADMKSLEQYKAELEHITDQQAHKLGYPSAHVLRLEDKLTDIAGAWRESKEEALVHEYKSVLYEMILHGYDVQTLPIQDQLPPEVMPQVPSARVQKAIQKALTTQPEEA